MDRNFRHQGDFWETLCYTLIPPYELYSHIDWLHSCNLASISPLHNETIQLYLLIQSLLLTSIMKCLDKVVQLTMFWHTLHILWELDPLANNSMGCCFNFIIIKSPTARFFDCHNHFFQLVSVGRYSPSHLV